MSLVSVLPSQFSILLPLFRPELPPAIIPLKSLCVLSPPRFSYNASEVLMYSSSLMMLSHCVSMCLLVGCFLLKLLMCPYFLKHKPISVYMCSQTLNPSSYTIKIMRARLVLRVLDI